MLKKFVVIKTVTVKVTEVFEVEMEGPWLPARVNNPSAADSAVSATTHMEPVAKDSQRSVAFQVMDRD